MKLKIPHPGIFSVCTVLSQSTKFRPEKGSRSTIKYHSGYRKGISDPFQLGKLMVFVVLLQNQCKTRQILISGKNADHRNIRSNFQKPVDFICQNFHLFNKRFNKISCFCCPLQVFSAPHHFLGQLRAIHQNRLPPANRNRQTITFHLIPP